LVSNQTIVLDPKDKKIAQRNSPLSVRLPSDSIIPVPIDDTEQMGLIVVLGLKTIDS